MEKKVYEAIKELKFKKRVNQNISIFETKYGVLSNVAVEVNERVVTFFPLLSTTKSVPVEIKSVLEWTHSDKIEAQILGSGREKFALNFFATDYAENREKYLKDTILNIALAGFAYVIDSGKFDEEYDDY